MPCHDAWMDRIAEQEKIDELTRMLCWLCGTLEGDNEGDKILVNPKLKKWWKEHKKSDTDRVRAEMRKIVKDNDRKRKNKQVLIPADIAAEFIARAEAVHAVSDFHKTWFHQLAREVIGNPTEG